MNSPAAKIAHLSPEKQALLAKLLQEKTAAPHTRIAKRKEHSPCVLSFAQERLWFLAQMDANSPFYNIAGVVNLQGNLNTAVLEQALNEVIRRHEALRTAFLMAERPQQHIIDHSPVSLLTVDLTDLNGALQEKAIADISTQEAHRVFDLTKTPLLRATLLKLDKQQHTLLMTLHHIVSDEWSLALFIKELSQFYEAFSQGKPSSKSELELQYADFASWQRQYLQGERQQKQLAYWKEQLANAPQLLELPTDKPRPVEMSYRGATHHFQLDARLSESLQRIAQQADSTLFMLAMAIFSVLLQRHAGQNDLCIGYPIANRNRREIENLIGFFVNTQVLRCDLSGNPRFTELLSQIRQHILNAQNHQELPFEQLVDELKPERSLNHTPLFQVMLVFQNAPVASVTLPNLSFDIAEAEVNFAKFDLTLTITNADDGLQCSFNYATDLFDENAIIKLAEHFQCLAKGIAEQPQARLSGLPLLTSAEQQQLLGNTAQDFSTPQTIAQLFEIQAEKNPDAIAVVFAEQTLNYRELNHQANQLARYLQVQGVKADVLVGVCLQRSIEMMIALLAIIKAGGAYLPLDPDYPPERLAYMLEDAKAALLITEQSLPEMTGKRFYIDSDWHKIESYSTENLAVTLHPLNLAYVIYTSGSTGNPKGVMVTHHQVTRLFAATEAEFQFDERDVWTLFHSFAFDFSVWEIWGALLYGGRLVIVPYWISRSPKEFSQLLQSQQVTVLNQTPSAFVQLVNLQPQDYALRLVIFGGEALELASLKPWFAYHGDTKPQLVNMYGITETTVHVTYRALTLHDCEQATVSPIGRPIADLQTYLLNEHYQLCPDNSRGELFVGGAGLARGYLNRPDLTAERFVPNPFGAAGSRLYKSGDLARRSIGDMDYAGRIDHQVKIRGFRIELGEIEAALLSHADIKEAVVLARDEGGRKQLVAYLITQQTVSNDELLAHLKQRLPDYMLPSAFVYLDSLPLTANGKLNRKALPAPYINTALNHTVAPQTAIEKTLVTIWQDLLGIEQIGIRDNFFALGGDSILSIQVVSRARQAGIIITPKQLFQHQTIATLAAVANREIVIAAEQGLVTGNVPLTPIQNWFFEQDFVNPQHWNQALLFEVKAVCSPEKLKQALQRLVHHHDALRLQFYQQQGVWQQRNLKEVNAELLIQIDLSSLTVEQQADALEKAATEQQARLNLTNGQLVRAVWFDLGAQQNPRVVCAIHHLAVDGVSWRILLEDLSTLLSGQTALPEKTTSFKQWAEQIRTGALMLNADYWLDSRRKEVVALPVENTAGLNTVATEQSISFSLSEVDTQALLKDVPSAYQTKIDDVLLSALAQTLSAWSGQSTLLIDLEGHGREDFVGNLDVSRTVGWFTSLFPVLLTLPTSNPLISIKEQLRAIPDKGVSYGWLRYSGNEMAQQLAELPKASVMFNYLGQFDTAVSADSPFIPLSSSAGLNRDALSTRTHEFEIVSHIAEGQLQITWRYSGERYTPATIAALIQNYQQQLNALIAHCILPESGAYTPSDFALAALTQAELDALDLPARQVEDLYPLAPLQQGLLFHSLYAPESGVYCVQMGCQLNGELNIELFKQAWQHIIEQYAVFRTRFYTEDWHKPLQQVGKQVVLPFTIDDWRELSEAEQNARWQQLLLDDSKTPFDFNHAPLMRLGLVQCGEKRHYFFWSHHHVLLDGWSNSLIMQAVFANYQSLVNGSAVPLPVIRPYRDYIAWLQTQDMQAAKTYWQTTLSGFTAPTSLGIAHAQHGAVDYKKHSLIFSTEQTQTLQDFVKQQQITLNTLLQGVWALLLSRYSGESDIVFGTTVSGRPAELTGVEFMVGLFINSLPMRVQIPAEISTAAWLKTLFEQNLELRRYEYTPLVQIQGWSDVPRGLPLFDSLLVFENYPIDTALTDASTGSVQRGELLIEQIATQDFTSYPLTVSAFPSNQFKLEMTYDNQRFDSDAIARMLGHLETLIHAIVEQPNTKLSELPLLTRAEQQQITAWNAATAVDYALPFGIHHTFEQQVEKTPDAIALVFGNERLSYAELNQRANQVAHYLLTLSVRADDRVAICMERNVAMIVGLLGILKAGGAYLPLDPNYPSERLAYMLNDAAPVALLTQSNLQAHLPNQNVARLLLDTQRDLLVEQAQTNPDIQLTDQQLAYIIYTSGSTGQPKGVMIEHRNTLNFIAWAKDNFSLPILKNTVFATSINFDLAVYELFVPLSVGATVHLAQDLLAVNTSDSVTLLNTVPSAMNALVHNQQVPDSVGMVNLAGEPLKQALVERIFATTNVETVANLYGPTETTTYSTWTCITKQQVFPNHIGRPIANTQIYILDAHLQAVPIGVTGEIYIGGAGVARGYLNRDDLTAERFIQHRQYGRVYKTGDLGRWLADGNIEYLGRNDFQVKIRGFRIELGEIEMRLLACQGVREAVVLARKDKADDKRLVAYLIAQENTDLSSESLRKELTNGLADYMIPSAFVILPEFPLTPNGKLNRNALPAPDFHASQQIIAPRTATEQMLVTLWTEVLELEQVGVQDDFFALGGHSLIATQLISRISKTFAIELPIKVLFDTGTIEKLAEQVDLALWANSQANTDGEFEEIEL